MKNDYVLPIAVLSLVCLLISGALAFMNGVTAPIIAEAAAVRADTARQDIIPGAEAFVLLEVEGLPKTVREVYSTSNGAGYVFTVTSVGYGGEIRLLCGISPDGAVIKTAVLAHNETQGLGTAVYDRAYEYEGKGQSELAGVDAISGATITSDAYRRAVDDAFTAFELVKGAN